MNIARQRFLLKFGSIAEGKGNYLPQAISVGPVSEKSLNSEKEDFIKLDLTGVRDIILEYHLNLNFCEVPLKYLSTHTRIPTDTMQAMIY